MTEIKMFLLERGGDDEIDSLETYARLMQYLFDVQLELAEDYPEDQTLAVYPLLGD